MLNQNKSLLLMLLVFMEGCASHPPQIQSKTQPISAEPKNAPAVLTQEKILDSSIEITYILGDNHYRFKAESKLGNIQGRNFIDERLIKENTIDPNRYGEFLQKAQGLLSETNTSPRNREPVSYAPCRTPFSIHLRLGKNLQNSHGCRSSDKGTQLSHLIREAEFLLYSKK